MKSKPIERYMNISRSGAVRVLLWLLNNRDSEGLIKSTLSNIAANTDVTKTTVHSIFTELYKEGFLEKIKNGEYKLRID